MNRTNHLKRMKRFTRNAVLAALLSTQLSACVGLLVAGAVGGGATVAMDRRVARDQAADKRIEYHVSRVVANQFASAHVNSEVFNRAVLLTGEVPTQAIGLELESQVRAVNEVRQVYNELVVAEKSSFAARAADTAITAKVKAAFLRDNIIQSSAIITTTERGTVYLQGQVSQAEGTRAAELARNVGSVRQVIKLFDYLTEEQIKLINR
jgi:osmotically-inducible protein OsmY